MARAQKKAQGDGSNKKKLNTGALKALWKKNPNPGMAPVASGYKP